MITFFNKVHFTANVNVTVTMYCMGTQLPHKEGILTSTVPLFYYKSISMYYNEPTCDIIRGC